MAAITHASDRLILLGRVFFAVGLTAWGIQHLVAGDFVTRVVPTWPEWLPTRTVWAYLVGVALIAAGIAILFQISARAAALAFGTLAFLSLVLLHLPLAVNGMPWGAPWTAAGKALVLWGGALCVAVSLPDAAGDTPGGRFAAAAAATRHRLAIWGRICLGTFMVLAGIQHFLFVTFVATFIPAWIPGAVFWAYFTGAALIAGGVGLVVPRVTRVASVLSGAMIFSWVFLVHLPIVLRDPRRPGEVAALFEALAFSGVAFLLAGLDMSRRERHGA